MTDATAEPVLEVSGLAKRFAGVEALAAVSLALRPGERVALLGHNGAGKSTLFKCVLGFLRPDGGTIRVAGAAPGSVAARRAVSYLPENVVFQKALTGREVLRLFATLKGEPRAAAEPLLERVGILHAADRAVGTYSKGMRQRLGLAQALIGRPKILLLDEPTSGLDPVSRREFYELIEAVAEAGTAVLLSSHSLSEVEARTDRVAILSRGRLVADDTLANLRRAAGLPIRIRIEAQAGTADEVALRLEGRRVNGRGVELVCAHDEKLGLLGQVAELGALVEDVEVALPSLDDVYRHWSSDGRGRA
ncbi:ABC transporter ATP-binding protein [Prosthecomicrobium sp. N25]|uniref:ABC transporter ATP-binding protein n=1 Tax=Prosthecomicrobium sp. N25 TaxID=3129254 RepID=UPI0030780523